MRIVIYIWAFLGVMVSGALAQINVPKSVNLDGETYSKAWHDEGANRVEWQKLDEYTRKGENVEGEWTKLFTIFQRSWPAQEQNPKRFIEALEKVSVQKGDKEFSAKPVNGGKEYYVSFKNKNGKAVEFNVFRVLVSNGALVSLQFATRVYTGRFEDLNVSERDKERWIQELSKLDFAK